MNDLSKMADRKQFLTGATLIVSAIGLVSVFVFLSATLEPSAGSVAAYREYPVSDLAVGESREVIYLQRPVFVRRLGPEEFSVTLLLSQSIVGEGPYQGYIISPVTHESTGRTTFRDAARGTDYDVEGRVLPGQDPRASDLIKLPWMYYSETLRIGPLETDG